MTSLAALPSNSWIYLGLIRWLGLISRLWQTSSTNFLLIKLYSVAQVLANDITSILFPKVHCIINGLLQKRFFYIKDEEINKFFSLTSKVATLFPIFCCCL